jgi:peptidoglycan/LPS O-acetylase OafA/YrhL
MEHSIGYAIGTVWSRVRNTDPRYSRVALDEPLGNHSDRDRKLQRPQQIWHQYKHHFEWLWWLSPWFIAIAFGKTQRRLPKKTSTSYLNGVRGVACIIVYLFHAQGYYDKFFDHPYGEEPAEEHRNLTTLPIVRVMWAGKGMVAVFFVLSGFVLTYSPLRSICQPSSPASSDGKLITGLGSSIIRRAIRLFGPFVSMIILTSLYPDSWIHDGENGVWRQVQAYLNWNLHVLDYWVWGGVQPQCWTLPVEFQGSMHIFLMCIATARLSTVARKVLLVCTALWHLHGIRGELYCFLWGMILAELRYNPLSEDFAFMRKITVPRRLQSVLAMCLLLISTFVISWPEGGDGGVEPYKTMSDYIPERWRGDGNSKTFFWSYLFAPGLVFALECLPSAQRLLSTAPMLYLGEISYSFYLLHWSALLWPGGTMLHLFEDVLGWSKESSISTMLFLTCLLLVVLSDYFWRTADEGSVRLGRKFAEWLGVHGNHKPCGNSTINMGSQNEMRERRAYHDNCNISSSVNLLPDEPHSA